MADQIGTYVLFGIIVLLVLRVTNHDYTVSEQLVMMTFWPLTVLVVLGIGGWRLWRRVRA